MRVASTGDRLIGRGEMSESGRNAVTELKVTASMMQLEAGVFCVFHAPGPHGAIDEFGLPGIRLSVPPGAQSGDVSISTFRPDGWIGLQDAAALVRVTRGPAPVMVTVYHSPRGGEAPRLQVTKVGGGAAAVAPAPVKKQMVAHIQARGDVGADFDEWMGLRGSRRWIEGFAIVPPEDVSAEDIEYQAVLGRDWLSPWSEGGQFLGSRGMALPILGFRVRLRRDAAELYDCVYEASFIDGSSAGPVENGEACESESLAPLEAFIISLRPRGADLE